MRFELKDSPDFAFLRVLFDGPGEQLKAETGAMLARDSGVALKTAMTGGLLAAAKRKLLGGETVFQNTFTSSRAGERLLLAPAAEGDLRQMSLTGAEKLWLSSGAYLASTPQLELDVKWGGAKGFFSGTGLFLLQCRGQGEVFFGAFGAIHEVEVGAQGYICDTSHIVGFTGELEYSVRRVGGLKSLLFSGEGLVCHFQGRGKLWLSTRNADRLAAFLHPFRPAGGSSTSSSGDD